MIVIDTREKSVIMENRKKLLVVDGNSIASRAFFGMPPLTSRYGVPVNAVQGFANIINRFINEIHPDYRVIAFDVHGSVLRKKIYEDYKANRKPMDDSLRIQMPYIKRLAEALGFLVVTAEGYEGDDVIGTVVSEAENSNEIDSYILTGDKDIFQLVSDSTTVLFSGDKDNPYYDSGRVFEKTGVHPFQVVSFKAIVGDSSDNYPGINGIGEKTAKDILSNFETLDRIYEDVELLKNSVKKSVFNKLTEGREIAYICENLARIRRNAPLSVETDELFSNRPVNEDVFLRICDELSFNELPKKFGITKAKVRPSFDIATQWRHTVSEIDAGLCPVIALLDDSVAVAEARDRVFTATGVTPEDLADYLRGKRVVCYDYKSLLRYTGLTSADVGCEFDVMLADYLLNSDQLKFSLTESGSTYAGFTPETPGEYASVVYTMYEVLKARISDCGLDSVLYEIEIPLSVVLADMESRGFKADTEGITAYSSQLETQEKLLKTKIVNEAGEDFNPNSPSQLGHILFEKLGLPATQNKSGSYSTDVDALTPLSDNEIVRDILDYRKITKLRGTYGEALANRADENGRIHTTFSQTGTATGRLASSKPNLQNIPVREEIGRELRKYFIADEGSVLIDADYSQIELRILASLADDSAMITAFNEGTDIHTKVASEIFRTDINEVTPEMRRRAKAVNFGIVYGIGAATLAENTGVTNAEAKEFISSYLETYASVNDYLEKTKEDAKEKGYTTTMFGRRRYIPELQSGNHQFRASGERIAMNSPVQGTAADVIKIAMIKTAAAFKEAGIDAHLILQVHDELIVEASVDCADEAERILCREMENAAEMAVKLTVEAGRGKSWFDAKH